MPGTRHVLRAGCFGAHCMVEFLLDINIDVPIHIYRNTDVGVVWRLVHIGIISRI